MSKGIFYTALGIQFVEEAVVSAEHVSAIMPDIPIALITGVGEAETPFGRPSMDHARSLIGYGIYSVIPSVEGEIHNWMDITLIGVFMSPAAVAAYEVAW